MTLTEKWKKGELPYGYYYIKTISGGEVIDRYYRDCTDYDLCEYGDVWENRFEDEIIEVLAPVPSYEEYSRLKWYAGCGPDRIVELNKENRQLRKWCEEFNALEVAKENQQLKELLKYCHYYIINTPVYPQGDDAKQVEIHKLSDQIINAIGEK